MAYVPRGVAVATTTRGELCRTALPADSDEGRARLLPRTLGDDTTQHLLDRRQRLGLTDLLTHDRRLEGLDDLILSADLGDEVRAHIATTISDRIEEGQRIDRRHLRLVAVGHPAKGGIVPAVGVVGALTDAGLLVAIDLELEVFAEAEVTDLLHIVIGARLIGTGDDLRHTDITGLDDGLRYGETPIATMMGVVVTYDLTAVLPEAVAYVDGIIGMDDPIIEGNHHRGDLEGRAWLTHIRHGHIHRLVVDARCGALEVGDRDDLTRLDLHQDDGTALRLEVGELLAEIALHDALDIHVQGRVDACPIDGGLADGLLVATHIIEGELLTELPTEEIVVAKLKTEARLRQPAIGTVVDMPDGAVSQRTEGIDTTALILRIDELGEEALLIPIGARLMDDEGLCLLEGAVLDVGYVGRIDRAVAGLGIEALLPACLELGLSELACREVEGIGHQLGQRVQASFILGTKLEDLLALGLLLAIAILRREGLTQRLEGFVSEVKEEAIDGGGDGDRAPITGVDRATHRLDSAVAWGVDLRGHLRIALAVGTEDEEDNAEQHEDHCQRDKSHDPGIAVVGEAVPLDTTLGLEEESTGEGLSRCDEGLELSGDCTQVH